MSKVRNENTSAEQRARSIAHRMGLRFRLKRRGLPGKPDFVLPKYRLAVFVHGCFWHRHPGCKRASMPRTRAEFWRTKFETNVERDVRLIEALAAIGWRSVVLWECEVRTPDLVRQRLSDAVRQCSQGASSS